MHRALSLAALWLVLVPSALALQFSAATYHVNERSAFVTLTVTRTAGNSGAASVNYSTAANSASPGLDFLAASGSLQWQSGDTNSKSIQIQILQDLFEEEPQEFFVTLSGATGEAIGARNTAQVIIDDAAVRFEELYTSVFGAPASTELLVSVAGFTPALVELFEGDTVIGTNNIPRPGDGYFTFSWTNVPRGSYTLRARAFDAGGFSITSPSRTILVSGPVTGANLAAVHVDGNNLSGLENGTPANPFRTIQQGVDNAATGAVIKVARGTYRESVLIDNKSLQLLGGYAGAGDFTNRTRLRVNVQPPGRRAGFGLYNGGDTVIEGFAISGGAQGVFIVGDTIGQSYPRLRRNLITGNGEPFRAHGGGGVHAQTSNLELTENEISFNLGGRGGGVSAGGNQAAILVQRNIIRGNIGHDDHGGGLYIMANGVIAGNLIQDNEVGKNVDYGGWGGGLILFGDSSTFFPQVALSNNIVTGNYAINGSAEFFDEGARAKLDHELIYKNRTSPFGGGALMVDGCCNTTVTVNHCTVADNEGNAAGGNGLNTDVASSASITNSIFWNNGPDEFAATGGSTIRVSYTLSGDVITSGNGVTFGAGNLRTDPLFADPANNDYRLKTTRGRWSPIARRRVTDSVSSPGIDAANPSVDFSGESLPHGSRADLGSYGNRAEPDLAATIVAGGLRIAASGANGRVYQLESSNDLETWSLVRTLTTTTGQMETTNAIPTVPRFYRLRQ